MTGLQKYEWNLNSKVIRRRRIWNKGSNANLRIESHYIIIKYYEAGHMMYTHLPSMEKFKKDVDEFIDETSN